MSSTWSPLLARLSHLLIERLPGRIILWPQNPLVIVPDSEPEPDIVLLGYRDDFYRHALPGPDDVALLIEVANTSLRYDRHVKGPLYAEAGVRDYWIVDLEGEAVEVSRQPQARRFHHNVRVARGDALSPPAFPETPPPAAAILGWRLGPPKPPPSPSPSPSSAIARLRAP